MIALTGCYSDFEPENDVNPVLVLNSIATNDSIVTAQISHTWLHTNPEPIPTAEIANVELTVNDSQKEKMIFDEQTKMFVSSYKAKSGDKIRVSANSLKYGEATGEVEVPNPVYIDTITTSTRVYTDHNSIIVGEHNWDYQNMIEVKFSIHFTDRADEVNYYMLEEHMGDHYCPYKTVVFDDPIFSEFQSVIDAMFFNEDSFTVFSDRSIQGKSYALSVKQDFLASRRGIETLNKITFKLRSISESYYKYLLSIYKKYSGMNGSLNDLGLGNDIIVYSNINPGVGIMAGSAETKYEFDIAKTLTEAMKEN